MQLVDANRSKHLQMKSTHWRIIAAGQKLLFSGPLQSFKPHPPPSLSQFLPTVNLKRLESMWAPGTIKLIISSHSITSLGLWYMKEDNLLHSCDSAWKGCLCGYAFPRGGGAKSNNQLWENLSTFLVIKIPLPHLPPPPSKHWALNMPGKLFATEPYPQISFGQKEGKCLFSLVFTRGGCPRVCFHWKNLDFL